MPTPTQRHTKSRKGRRRSHHALKAGIFSVCSKCHEQKSAPHNACSNCGFYRGKEVINVLAKLDKKEKKKKEKEMEKQGKQQQKKELKDDKEEKKDKKEKKEKKEK